MRQRRQTAQPQSTATHLREQASPSHATDTRDGASPEPDRRVEEAAARASAWVDNNSLPRWLCDATNRLIGEQSGVWFPIACDGYDRRTTLDSGASKYQRASALNVWISVATWWLALAPAWNAPVYYFLYEYMKANGAPLPRDYGAATRARQRLVEAVRSALDPHSKMSRNRRRRLLGENPNIASTLAERGLRKRYLKPLSR